MYWFLIFLPVAIEITYTAVTYFGDNNPSSIVAAITAIWMFIAVPVYLLFVSIHYINVNGLPYLKAFLWMLIIFILRVGYMLIFHWIKYGKLIGDVPVQIYQAMIVVSVVITLIGLVIHYFIKGRLS